MEKVSKKVIFIALILVVTALGISYSFFNYYRLSEKQYEVITGKIFLNFVDGSNTLSLTNVFPETREEALKKTNNVLNFSIEGRNTTEDKDLYFEIMLNEGNDIEGKKRLKPLDLRFDLVETTSGKRVTLFEDMGYNDFNGKRIWVDTVPHGNETNISKSYELRMWISDDVIISDTESYADYKTDDFKNSFANVKVSVYGDFIEKSVPYNYMNNNFGTEINNLKANIKEVHFVSMDKTEINNRTSNATIKYDVTNTSKSKAGSVMAWLEEDELVTNADSTTTQYYKMYVASDGITFFPSSVSNMFADWTNVNTINFENVDTRYVTTMPGMFSRCSGLTSLDISAWDVSSVTTMKSMFSRCSGLTSLDISAWDVSSVTNMSYMFSDCSSLTSLDLSNWDVSSVTTMPWMFSRCSGLTSLDISAWDVSSVTTMYMMFYSCSSLINFDLSNWDVSSVTTMEDMFHRCNNLTNVGNLSNWNVSSVTIMEGVFQSCNALTSLDISNWDVSSVTNMSYMFSNCISLTSIGDLSTWDVSSVTTMEDMFYDCSSLKSLDLSTWDVSSVTTMEDMFYDCSSLKSLDLSTWDVSSVTSMKNMFRDCTSLTTIYVNSNWQEVATNLTSSSAMFSLCYKLVGKVAYSSSNASDITMANPDGYFTSKNA